ncbi:PAS domain S-box protein [Haloarchaeobius sp. TZWSO28]|uniref:PAS domain S-box protein n=1 Tax=Haloarchaeobius sp. TZWSO28 TaxID=3446119 RepID=UPI003EBABF6E
MSHTRSVLYVGSHDEATRRSVNATHPDDWHVITATSAAEAGDALAANAIDCVLCDHDLPDGTGLAVLDAIEPAVPILYRTADPDGEVAAAATAAGATGYCYGDDDLAERLRGLLESGDAAADPAETPVVASDASAAVILDRIGEAFFAVDDEWRFTYVNETAATVLESTSEALLGQNIWNAFPAATDLPYYEEYTKAMASQEPVSFEAYYPPLDLWTDVTAYPDPDGLSVFFRDVTRRKRYEQMLPGLLHTTRDMMQARDRETIAARLVKAADELLGLDLTVVRFYDPERELLVPVAGTDSLGEVMGDRPTYAVGDGGPGEAFESGQSIFRTGVQPTDDDDARIEQVEAALYLPLGDHGTLSAAFHAETGLGPVERQTAELLAANATAALDRTERRERLERFEAVIDSVEDMLYVLGPDGEFTYVTRPFAEFVGYDRDELVGGTPARITDEAVVDRIEDVISDLWDDDDRRSGTVTAQVVTASGTLAPIELDVSLLPAEDGEFAGSVGVVRDVTDLRETREQLRSENERFRYLFDHIPDPLVECEFCDDGLIVTSVNPAFEEVFGYDSETIVGEGLNDYIVPPDEVETASRMDRETAAEGELTEEVRRLTTTGERHFLFRGVSYELDGTLCGFGTYTDITERKERERRLEVLHTVLRHNLRTEMNLIGGYAEQLERKLDEDFGLVEDIQNEARHVANLSDTARNVERALDRADEYTVDRRDVTGFVTSAVEKARSTFPEAEISLDQPASVEAMADDRLVFALTNALENAVEHCDEAVPRIVVTVESCGETVEIRIADNGPGIPEQERKLVTGERDITQLEHGSGLGLWAITWVVNAFDGELSFETSDDGSVVVLRLRQ